MRALIITTCAVIADDVTEEEAMEIVLAVHGLVEDPEGIATVATRSVKTEHLLVDLP